MHLTVEGCVDKFAASRQIYGKGQKEIVQHTAKIHQWAFELPVFNPLVFLCDIGIFVYTGQGTF